MGTFQTELDTITVSLDQNLDTEISSLLEEKGLKVVVMETITGGSIAQRFSLLSNSSQVFSGGIVCSHPLHFVHFCSVSPAALRHVPDNRLSEDMVHQLSKRNIADVYISSTGIMGAEKQPDFFTSKLWFSLKLNDKLVTKHFVISGSKKTISNKAAQAVFVLLQTLLDS